LALYWNSPKIIFLWLRNSLKKFLKKSKKIKREVKNFFKNEHPKNKKMGKIPKKNNFPKKNF